MKRSSFVILAGLFANFALGPKAIAGPKTNSTYLEVLQASNNVARIIQVLPDVERLWPQHPGAYLKSINQAARALNSHLNSSEDATQAFTNTFVRMMQKPCPTNEVAAASWISQKREMVFFYVVHDQIGRDKPSWISVAQFLGEIRSKRIPNYSNRSMMISGLANTPSEKAELQREIADNERKKITDNFQSELWQADSTLMFLIQHVCPFTQQNGPYDTNLINQIASAGHLTAVERKQLLGQ